VEDKRNENKIDRRGFLSLLLMGGIAFALGGFAALFGKQRAEDNPPPANMKKAAYWRRVE
jgi:hypothetical protein